MSPSGDSIRTVRFGAFELDLAAAELRKGGVRLRIQEQPFQVLAALLEKPGEVITREDLIRRLWADGTVVDFDRGLNAAVTRLRQVLSDSAEAPRYVETVARRGYRFLAVVEIPMAPVETPAAPVELVEPVRKPDKIPAFPTRLRVILALLSIAAIASAGWLYYRSWRAGWTRKEALPKIQALIVKGDYPAAFDLTRTALGYVSDDPQLNQHWSEVSLPIKLTTTPPGALVSYRPYGDAESPWRPVGITPLDGIRIPLAYVQLRVEKEGSEPAEFAAFTPSLMVQNIALHRAGQVPAGMVSVPAREPWTVRSEVMPLPDYFLDKFEVTNQQYQRFVDAGGYRDVKYWRAPFRKNGREIPFVQAVEAFRDTTGRPGPAAWELGTFPKDQGDVPVSGVSWFEAGAYCAYAGKSLPTVHHWRKAAGFGISSDILVFSNFANGGPARVGAHAGISAYGAFDMAGNVKEWCENAAGDAGGELRAILGGGWDDPPYSYREGDAQDPFSRRAAYGLRCAAYPSSVPPPAMEPLVEVVRDYSTEKPVGDDVFAFFRGLYEYDQAPLDAKTERVDDSNANWRRETVSCRAAYGDERIPAYLYLPRNVKPPYQTVLWFPGGYALQLRNSGTGVGTEYFNFLLSTGRAVLYPVYQGTFERRTAGGRTGPHALRDQMIQVAMDVSRSVDYFPL